MGLLGPSSVFDADYPIKDIKPAPYNPRAMDEEARCALRASIASLGLLKPLILCSDRRLLAGHQRLDALTSLRAETAAAFVLPPVSYEDEVRFNQLHNAADLEISDAKASVPPLTLNGWATVDPDVIEADDKPKNAAKRAEIFRLLTKYGPWGACAALQSGEILTSGLYAGCCRVLGIPLTVYYATDSLRDAILAAFSRDYGTFSYSHLPRTPWTQGRTQMRRLRSDQRGGKSRTYEHHVIPRLTKDMRILDFGCGYGDYAARLTLEGYDITALEFYPGNGHRIDSKEGHRGIDRLIATLERGRFDLVICDSVLNSVDSAAAESDVLTCLAAFCTPGGTVIFSGRSREFIDYEEQQTVTNTPSRRVRITYLDANSISGHFTGGVWRYQKYHTRDQAKAMCRSFFGDDFTVLGGQGNEGMSTSWVAAATNHDILPPEQIAAAILREFDLPLSPTTSYGRGQDVLDALMKVPV